MIFPLNKFIVSLVNKYDFDVVIESKIGGGKYLVYYVSYSSKMCEHVSSSRCEINIHICL